VRQAEKGKKKILVPNQVHTRPGQENSEKTRKKIHKKKNPLFGIIFSQNGMIEKNILARIPFILDPGKKIPKKKQKNSKN